MSTNETDLPKELVTPEDQETETISNREEVEALMRVLTKDRPQPPTACDVVKETGHDLKEIGRTLAEPAIEVAETCRDAFDTFIRRVVIT